VKKMVIVADSSFVIETIRLALRSAAGLNVIGKVDGRAPVRRPIAEAQPEIVLVDEMQNSEHALERIRECREEAPSSVILLLTMRMDDEWVGEAIAAGCDACLSKSAHLPSLGTLIREIVARNIVTALPATLSEGKLPLAGGDDLTAREREILGLVADGLTNARIGRELWVTEQTVKFHLSNIYRKLSVSNRTEASRYAYMHGMLRGGPRLVAPAAGGDEKLASVSELRPLTTAPAA
jgi:DNA-binding NarL/FixJ family response regulator